MADTKKFLDQSGVSVLWNQVVAKINAIPAYDDSQVKADIAANASAIAVLNGTGEGSVAATAEAKAAAKVAEIVAGADASFDTLKEIADWISNDTTGAASMANDIAALEALVGDTAVATQIANAISDANLSQYALASELTTLAGRVSSVEGDITNHGTRLTAVETKASNNATDIDAIKTKIEDITSTGGEPNVIESISVNGVKQPVTEYNVDIAVPVIEALTEDEIKAACV